MEENTPIQVCNHWIEGKRCGMDLVLFPNRPATWGRKATGYADDQDQNPCYNRQDLIDQ